MKAATLLIVLLSGNGYWFGDRVAEVRFESSSRLAAGRVVWALAHGPLQLAGGVSDLDANGQSTLRLSPPAVRVRTTLRLVYRLADAAGNELDAGERPVHLFPDNIFEDAAHLLAGKRLAVWASTSDPLATFLTNARVPHDRFDGGTTLLLRKPDVVIFPPGSLDSLKPEFRPPLASLARGGSTVIVFRQERPGGLASYPLLPRTAPARLEWRMEHPLLSPFTSDELEPLAPPGSTHLAVRVSADEESALPLSVWPAEPPAAGTFVDALLVTRTVGRGRLVLCQLPFGKDWSADPIAQMFLRAALEYGAASPPPPPDARQFPDGSRDGAEGHCRPAAKRGT